MAGNLPGGEFRVEVIDTWEMTVTPLAGTCAGRCEVNFPGKECQALRIRKAT